MLLLLFCEDREIPVALCIKRYGLRSGQADEDARKEKEAKERAAAAEKAATKGKGKGASDLTIVTACHITELLISKAVPPT